MSLTDRSLGWLRFVWDKATTPDDWSDQGEPHPWWDRYGSPPMCAFPRFDLAETAYALPVMAASTPAWREAYVRIADELLARFTSFWGAIDWNTLIGPDPNVDRYSPEWLCCAPEELRGAYPLPGWTGNGVEPWGLQLYDALHGTELHRPFPRWAEYARTHYMGWTPDGDLDWFAFYYDPIEDTVATLHEPYNALVFLHLLLPQEPAWATRLYESCVRALGYSDPRHPVAHLARDPRMIATALVLARELGDDVTEARLRDAVEEHYEPRFFGPHGDRFGYWFCYDEPWPRGQLNALLAVADAGSAGSWSDVFHRPPAHDGPTISGVDFPRVAIRSTRTGAHALEFETAVTAPDRGETTTLVVDTLPDPAAVTVTVDERPHAGWRVTGPGAITLRLPLANCRTRVAFGM